MDLIEKIKIEFGTPSNPKSEVPTPLKIGKLEKDHLNALRLDSHVSGAYCIFNAYRGARQAQEIRKIIDIGSGIFEENFVYSIQRAAFLQANGFISKEELHESELPKEWNLDYFHEFAYILESRKVPKPGD